MPRADERAAGGGKLRVRVKTRQQKPIGKYRDNRMENKTRLLVLARLLTAAGRGFAEKSNERNKPNLQRL